MTALLDKMRKHLIHPPKYVGVDSSERLAREAGIPPEEVLRLNANENPFGSHPAIQAALVNLPLHLYPDPKQERLRGALSEYTGHKPEFIIAGAGGDEIIDLIIKLFIEPGDTVMDFEPTFGMYEFCSRIAGAHLIHLPRHYPSWRLDLDEFQRKLTPQSKIVFIVSPNNPTGNLVSDEEVIALLEVGIVVVADETYYEFSGRTLAHLLHRYENFVILRSFSKWAGIAGLRAGYALSSPTIINRLMAIKQPYNINVAAEAAVLTAVEHAAELHERVRELIKNREHMEKTLSAIPNVSFSPSDGNFLLCKFTGRTAENVHADLARHGIFVRRFSHASLADSLRISVGTKEQTVRLLDTLSKVL